MEKESKRITNSDLFLSLFSSLVYVSFFVFFSVSNSIKGKPRESFNSSLLYFPPFNSFHSFEISKEKEENASKNERNEENRGGNQLRSVNKRTELESPTKNLVSPKTWGGKRALTFRKPLDQDKLLALQHTLRDKLVEQLQEVTVKKEDEIIDESAKKVQKAALKTGFDVVSDCLSQLCTDLAKVQLQFNQKGSATEAEKENILSKLKTFAEVTETIVAPPVEANTKAVVRKRLPSFKNASEVSSFFASTSSTSSPSSPLFRQKQWREEFERNANSVCKSVSAFVESLNSDSSKVLGTYSQGMKDISNIMKGTSYSILGHQSISSKDVHQASQTIKSSIDSVKSSSDSDLDEFVKTAASVSAVMEKLGNALGNCSDLEGPTPAAGESISRVSSTSNAISIVFFVKAMQEFSVKLEEKAGKSALSISDASLRERITDGTKEMRGAFVFLQLAISQATNESKMKKMLEKARSDSRKSLEEGKEVGKGPVPYLQLSAACVSVAEATSKLIDLIKNAKESQRKSVGTKESQEKSSLRKTGNIFEEKDATEIVWTTDPTDNRKAIKNATLNQLALHFFTTDDDRFTQIFLQTLPSFSSPLEMIAKWEEFYIGISESAGKDTLESTKKTVEQNRDKALDLLLKYVEEQGSLLSSLSRQNLLSFLSKDSYGSEESRQLQAKRKYIKQMVQKLVDGSVNSLPVTFNAKSLLDSMDSIDVTRFIFQIPIQDLAVQLTLLDQQIFRSIKNVELLGQCWTKDKTKHLAFRLLSMINRFNNISLWAASTILWQEDEDQRNEAITQLISLSEALFKLRSYNAFFAIIASLQFTAINRIVEPAFESEKVPKKKKESYQEMLEIMNPKGSFKTYRNLLKDAGDNPCIPFMGMYLTDLVFTDEGNLSFLDEEDTQINWAKYSILYDIIARIQRFQKHPFTQQKDEKIATFLIELPHLNKDKLVELSFLIKPRKV
eukprot:TRINITY_DN3512_c0_g1_i1.p1 TRINITY_DN3512_c0_g1~~TRINITY_DN3512_c0_g1_i1.p1  ORF type:complete len:958 (-),score=412.98 TRINITY_DN3512_c0_g1_i1:108-2981(-)